MKVKAERHTEKLKIAEIISIGFLIASHNNIELKKVNNRNKVDSTVEKRPESEGPYRLP